VKVQTVVTPAAAPLDLDAWVEQYVGHVLTIDASAPPATVATPAPLRLEA